MLEVSFVIIAYNEEKNIDRCLKSIERLDGIQASEIIVIDDGSKDRTLGIVQQHAERDPRVRAHVLGHNQGRGAARAAGVKEAKGKYIAFIDADIILPKHWYMTCLSYMSQYDVVGGLAVPDADVNFVYMLLGLDPKTRASSITVNGANGLYKREVFDTFNFDSHLRDGEDSVLLHLFEKNQIKTRSISTLIVEHKESKSFTQSIRWLYEVGRGASWQLKRLKVIRFPDLAALGFIAIIFAAIFASFTMGVMSSFLLLSFYVLLTATAHLYTRFSFHFREIYKYPLAIGVQSVLIASYYIGRCVGMLTERPTKIKKTDLFVCFDTEGHWGMSGNTDYDFEQTLDGILSILGKLNIKGTFFVAGKLIEEWPEMIKKISNQGHHIALHGYVHERLDQISKEDMSQFSKNLAKVEEKVLLLTGKRPTGFRAPFLMDPVFHSPLLYSVLKSHGYTWVSNRSIRHERELFPVRRVFFLNFILESRLMRVLLLLLLNWRFIVVDTVDSKSRFPFFKNINWLLRGMPLFERNGLIEVPAHAPFDCELVGLPDPKESTPQLLLDHAVGVLVQNARDARGPYNITFHDWIIGSNNRLQILEETLSSLSKDQNINFILPDELIKRHD